MIITTYTSGIINKFLSAGVNFSSVPDSTQIIPLREFSPWMTLQKSEHITLSIIYITIFLIIFAFIRLRGEQFFSIWKNVLLHQKKVEIILNDGIAQYLLYYILALCLSISVLSTGISFLTLHRFDLTAILYIGCILGAWHIFSIISTYLTGQVFNFPHMAKEGVINIWVFNILFGIIIAPFLFAIFFVKSFAIATLTKIVIFCIILLYIFKISRWLKIFFHYKVSILYMILYLCVLEVLPILTLYKMLRQYIIR